MIGRGLIGALVLFSASLFAETTVDVLSAEEQTLYSQHQQAWKMWAVSRDYQHGTTVPQNPFMAYVWFKLYVQTLPNSYPGLQKDLAALKTKLSEEELSQVDAKLAAVREKHDLNFRLSESDLRTIFALREKMPTEDNEQSGSVVGYFDVNQLKMHDVNIILQPLADTHADSDDPWDYVSQHVTVMPDGEFYVENLPAAAYRVIASSHGKVLHTEDVSLRAGQRHNLGELVG